MKKSLPDVSDWLAMHSIEDTGLRYWLRRGNENGEGTALDTSQVVLTRQRLKNISTRGVQLIY